MVLTVEQLLQLVLAHPERFQRSELPCALWGLHAAALELVDQDIPARDVLPVVAPHAPLSAVSRFQ